MVQRREVLGSAVLVLAVLLACVRNKPGNATWTITPVGQKAALKSKPKDCSIAVYRTASGLGEFKVVASLLYEDKDGDPRDNREIAENTLRSAACQVGADAIVITQEYYSVPGLGTRATADAVVLGSGGQAANGEKASGTTYGTCFAVRPDGTVVTAGHVVDGAKTLKIQFPGKAPLPAKLLSSNNSDDLAVLKADAATPAYLPLVSSSTIKPGERVFTLGFPVVELLGDEPKFTDGSVSALSGIAGERRLMQVTVPIQPGNSGGPVVTETGFVIGVITSTAAAKEFFEATGTLPQGINWAVKADLAIPLFDADPGDGGAAIEHDRAHAIALTHDAVCAVIAER